MIAILLYIIGLVSALVTLVMVGFDAPAIYSQLMVAYNSGVENLLPAAGRIATSYNWALTPFLGGLLLMGFARVIVLLGAVNRALRHPV
ncbi:MAG TPA: hypothetical protein VG757_13910 [Devosia sp.]|nr:hypothetical protein [Devosia sp.]